MTEDQKTAKQVADQCRAVAHMATAIAEVHNAMAEVYADRSAPADMGFVDFKGRLTARLMETLGDTLNNMDAVTDEDDWLDPIFKEAQRRWPT